MYGNEKAKATRHALERTEERLEYSGKRAERLVERAWERGKRREDYENGKSKSFLSKKSGDGVIAVFFGDSIFIFNRQEKSCITCYKAPMWFGQKKRKRSYVRGGEDGLDYVV